MERQRLEQAIASVAGRLKNLQRPDWEQQTLEQVTDAEARKHLGLFPRDFGMEPWDWPQGVGLYGMNRYYKATGDEATDTYLRNWFAEHLNGPLPRRNINTTCPLLTLADYADEAPAYASLCQDWAEWLMHGLPRTKERGFQHTTTKDAAAGTLNLNENQMWIDTLFMTVLFLAKWGVRTGNADYLREAEYQFLMMIKYLYEKRTGLFYHAWTFAENSNFGNVFWCRGNSWYTAASLDFIEIMEDRIDPAVKELLVGTYKAQVDALCACQAENGLWHTVLTDPDSYCETSGSAAITYGILKGIHSGVLPEAEYRAAAERALEGILGQIAPDGTVQGVSAGTPVGRDAAHYKSIRLAPMAYGQSLTLMALAEALCK